MRKPIKEIENVLQNHRYSIDTIIFDVMKTFKLKTICCQVGFRKQEGYNTSESSGVTTCCQGGRQGN